jgi:peptidoglycan/xylan/chitin deacetylase (PgdA/CDA1 family)
MYHRIADETFDPWGMAVSPENFTEQAEWLARNRKVVPLVDFAQAQRAGKLPQDAVAITFDDGYACTFTTAAPVLDRLRLAATVFVSARPIQKGGEFWWDELERLVLNFAGTSLLLDGVPVALGQRSALDKKWRPYDPPRTARQKAFRELWSRIRAKPPQQLEAAMEEVRRQVGEVPPPRHTHAVASVEQLRSSTIEKGCHGLTHASLPKLSGREQLREIEHGKSVLAELVGTVPKTFSYPFGDRDSAVERSVASAGFTCACASRQAFVRRSSDLFALPRLVVENVGAQELARMLAVQ